MRKVLITGGAGFIGFHLAKDLADKGYQVDLLDDLSRGMIDTDLRMLMGRSEVRFLRGDLSRRGALKGLGRDYHYIYHLASIIGVANVERMPAAVLRENALMLINVLDLARKQTELQRLLFASTSEVYAGTLRFFDLPIPTPETVPLTISEFAERRTSYMLAKLWGEGVCHYSDVPWTIVRPHNVYGPRMGMSHVVPELLGRAHHSTNGVLEVYSVEHRRSFCYVTDAVAMIRAAAEADACLSETLNVGNGEPEVTIGELAKIVTKVTGKPLEIVPKAAPSGSPARRCPDMTRTIGLTGYVAGIDLDSGIATTYDWYKTHVFAAGDIAICQPKRA